VVLAGGNHAPFAPGNSVPRLGGNMYQVWTTQLNIGSHEGNEANALDTNDVITSLIVETDNLDAALKAIDDECLACGIAGTDEEPALYSIVLCQNGKPIVAHEVSLQYAMNK
jgi:hypothetical protein